MSLSLTNPHTGRMWLSYLGVWVRVRICSYNYSLRGLNKWMNGLDTGGWDGKRGCCLFGPGFPFIISTYYPRYLVSNYLPTLPTLLPVTRGQVCRLVIIEFAHLCPWFQPVFHVFCWEQMKMISIWQEKECLLQCLSSCLLLKTLSRTWLLYGYSRLTSLRMILR